MQHQILHYKQYSVALCISLKLLLQFDQNGLRVVQRFIRMGTQCRSTSPSPWTWFTLSAATVAIHCHDHAPPPSRPRLDSGRIYTRAYVGVCGNLGRDHGRCDDSGMQCSSAYRGKRLPTLLLSRCDAFLHDAMPRSSERGACADATHPTTRRAARHYGSRPQARAVLRTRASSPPSTSHRLTLL